VRDALGTAGKMPALLINHVGECPRYRNTAERQDMRKFQKQNPPLSALSGSVTTACLRRAVAGLGDFPIGTDAVLGVHAPEQPVVRRLHVRIGFRKNELAFPAQCGAEIPMRDIKAIGLANHAAPPAFKMALLTATCARWTLCEF